MSSFTHNSDSQMNTQTFSAPTNLPKIYSRRKGRMHAICRALVTCVGLFSLVSPASGQTHHIITPLDAAFAGAVTARSGDIRFASGNPASLRGPARTAVLASFTPSALGIEGYREGSFIGGTSLGHSFRIGLQAATLEAGAFRESSAQVIAAGYIHPDLTVGTSVALHNRAIDGYGSRSLPAIDIGMLVQLAPRFHAGASFTNITRSAFDEYPLPQRLALGLLYEPDSTFSFSLDVLQELERSSGVAFGLAWKPVPQLKVRGGIGSEPGRLGYGLGYSIGDIVLDYGGSYTEPLGFRQIFGAGLTW